MSTPSPSLTQSGPLHGSSGTSAHSPGQPSKGGEKQRAPAMERLIPMINQLQDVFNVLGSDNKIDLPQIVVVGSQSAGKSSVLEALCHRDFLPRGSGIVTRRPLILQLHNIPEQPSGQPQEWGEFLHAKGKMFTNFDEIRKEIEAETDKLAGTGKAVVDEPINLKLYSPYVLDLTLVDLPGIARNPVGDQPKNIEFLIKDMVMKYITKPNALILAVTAANTDLATSDAISLAAEVDPKGDRTIGVLTKLDLMDKGTDASQILLNREHPLKLGWTAVINRSQADIDGKKGIEAARTDERKFFLTDPHYRDMADTQGTDYLAAKLNRILIRHIQKTLPSLRQRVSELYDKYNAEMASYGTVIDEADRGSLLLQYLTQYSTEYCNTIEGRSYSLAKTKLEGGSRIGYIFYEVFKKMLDAIDPTEAYSQNIIRTVVRNASGPRMSLFFPEHVLELFVQNIITRMGNPCQKCVDLVEQELVSIARATPNRDLMRYRRLAGEIVTTAEDLLHSLAAPCHDFIKNVIECELAYVNTMHPDFVSAASQIQGMMGEQFGAGSSAVSPSAAFSAGAARGTPNSAGTMGGRSTTGRSRSGASSKTGDDFDDPLTGTVPDRIPAGGAWSDSERLACEIIPQLMDRYYSVIRKKIEDTVPKAAMHFLVDASTQKMQRELISRLYREERIGYFFEEDPEITRKRNECRVMLRMLQKANLALDKMLDLR